MDLVLLGKMIAILALVVGNAYFVGSEVAITAARRSRIKQLSDMGDERAKVVKLLHDEPTRFYAVTQIGITLVSMALGYIGMDAFKELMSPMFQSLFGNFMALEAAVEWGGILGLIMGFIIVSFLHVVGGELAPKVLAYNKAEAMCLLLGGSINFLYKMWVPVIWVMNHASNYLLIAFGHGDIVNQGDGHGHDSSSMSAEELSMVVSACISSGSVKADQGRILTGVFDLAEESVQDAMVPKPDVRGIPATATIADALAEFSHHNHHAYPVIDSDKVVGTILLKKVMTQLEENITNVEEFIKRPISDLMRSDPFIFPTSLSLMKAWQEFRANDRMLGVVVDEHGSMVGVVTPNDIISRLVGQYPGERANGNHGVNKLKGSQWEIVGTARVADLEQALNFPFPRGTGYSTIGGLVFNRIGRIPEVGDVVEVDNSRIQILEIEELRIVKVLFQVRAVDASGKWALADTDSPEADVGGIVDIS
jgi:putative hemolysin